MKELEKNYNPADIEGRLYQKWLDSKYFHAKVNPDKKPFTIPAPKLLPSAALRDCLSAGGQSSLLAPGDVLLFFIACTKLVCSLS